MAIILSRFQFFSFQLPLLRHIPAGPTQPQTYGDLSTQVLAIIYHLIRVLFIQILGRENVMVIPAYGLLCLGHWIGKGVWDTNKIAREQSKVQACRMSPKAHHLRNHRRKRRGWPWKQMSLVHMTGVFKRVKSICINGSQVANQKQTVDITGRQKSTHREELFLTTPWLDMEHTLEGN